ncbi:MAG TPA: alpha/beta hydrolase [Gammaproteobacteria bacterium]|nr:alpha/beta hydrolase [Gammaproteobacteria bacterium]
MPFIIHRHRRLWYQDVGSGFPLLFGHGFLWDRKMWQPQIEILSQHYRCIVPDLWSHGASESVPQRPYSIELLSKDFYYLMDKLNLPEFAVIGQSISGMWGAQLSLNHANAVKALIMMDTFVGEEPIERKLMYSEILHSWEHKQHLSDEIIEKILPFFFTPSTFHTKPELIKDFKTKLKQLPVEQIEGLIEIGHTIFSRRSILDKLGLLKMPVLIMVGENDYPRPIHEAETMARYIPHAKLKIIADSGHVPSVEQPEIVTKILQNFLSEALADIVIPAKIMDKV